MEVSSYDEALSIPTEEAALLALRVQQVIQEESNITAVSDPLAGSYYVEALTAQMAEAIARFAESVEAQGGFIAAQRSGWIRNEIEASAERWRDAVNRGDKRIVGLNCYKAEDKEDRRIFRVDPEAERIAVERVQQLRESRDANRHDKALQRFHAAAHASAARTLEDMPGSGHELMNSAIEAADADATTGEMMAVLKEAYGWGPPHEF